jgi:hypothetical protein
VPVTKITFLKFFTLPYSGLVKVSLTVFTSFVVP